MVQRIIILLLVLLSPLSLPVQAQNALFGANSNTQFVPVDQAFSFDFQQKGNQLQLSWQIRPGYYLYRQQLKISPQQAQLGPITLPTGEQHKDEFFGEVEIYRDALHLSVSLLQAGANAQVSITYQGCAAAGFCYPPETRVVPLRALQASAAGVLPNTTPEQITVAPVASSNPLPFSPLWALLFGIAIAFTPCVLPMYPLISSLILGREKQHSSGRIFLLALVYVQGMAVAYTLLGLVVAAAGLQFQAALQHPYVLITLAVIFVLLALSMFGLFSLQLPSALQTRLTLWSNTQQGGSLAGVFAMGALAGLICSPCTTAPLSAILLYIAQSGNMLAGGGTLYLYALGMGILLILVTLFGHRLLPRSGPWMQYVKQGFGFIILALPVFLLERVLGDDWGLRLWSLLGMAFFGWGFVLSLQSSKGLWRGLSILLLAATLIVARPLQDWAFPTANNQPSQISHLSFQPVANLSELQQALPQAAGKTVMLDLYADWCVACKEFEKYTFSDAQVQNALSNSLLLQADVTANNAEQSALLKQLQVLGLPTILFFNAQGEEIPNSRVTGFMDANQFRAHLQKVLP